MIYRDNFNNPNAIGQYGTTIKVNLSPNVASLVILQPNQLYRLLSTDTIHVKQSDKDTIQANFDDCMILFEHEDYFHTNENKIYLSLICANSCEVYITEL